ncbi:MAG TPA: hypothetical protein VLD63_11835 [Anaerolineales bacterium]|nr:hypothetical protein [Anaerolineales bacterium]
MVNGNAPDALYLCARCLLPGDAPGPCPRCGRERLTCRPGDPDDPCRRPVIDAAGKVRTRAPLWWLKESVAPLIGRLLLPTRQEGA